MQRSEKFFIFTWKELTVIGLLAAISMGFFFTLGLHYGKKLTVAGAETQAETHESEGKIEEGREVLPPRETLEQGAQHSGGATSESIKEATQAEIQQAGVKLESPKQVELPAAKRGGAEPHGDKPETAGPEAAPAGRFAVQLGSYPSKKEAQLKIKSLSKKGIHSEVRTATVNGSLRYRVVIPGFAKKAQADQRGRELQQKHKIDTFITIKSE